MPRLVSTATWAERNISLFGKPFRREDYIHALEPMDYIDRLRGRTFMLRFPPQVFKTLAMQILLARSVDNCPSQTLWYAVTSRDARDFADEKLGSLLGQTKACYRKLPLAVDDQGSKVLYRYIDSPVSLLSSEVEAHRNSRSAETIFIDEAWQYDHGHVAAIMLRSDSYKHTCRIIIGETAPEEGRETDTLYQTSSQRLWHFTCPSCGGKAHCEHGGEEVSWGLKWERNGDTCGPDGIWDPVRASLTTTWVCPLCATPIQYSPSTLAKMNDTKRGAGYVQTNATPDPKVESWRATGMVFHDWQEIVAKFLTAVNALKRSGDSSLLREYKMKSAMLPWIEKEVHNDKVEYPYGGYTLGEEWPDEVTCDRFGRHRIITVDVQQTHMWALCRQYGARGRSRLMGFTKLIDEHELEAWRNEMRVPETSVYMDVGYDPKSNKAELGGRASQMAARRGYMLLNGIDKGDRFGHADGIRRIYSEPLLYDAFQGTGQQGEFPFACLIRYASTESKTCLRNLRDQVDEITGERLWTIADDASEEYKKQAWAERYVVRFEGHTKVHRWVKAYDDNHAFDLECMQYIVSRILGLADNIDPAPSSPQDDGTRSSS